MGDVQLVCFWGIERGFGVPQGAMKGFFRPRMHTDGHGSSSAIYSSCMGWWKNWKRALVIALFVAGAYMDYNYPFPVRVTLNRTPVSQASR